ncbi:hypothetical protein ACOXXX_07405 [Thalassococcus sp. BH17M4-6]|uniref:hypothetical protein n=1 Tax=Thalassococcus sp. BH17M4-6 TaxID=3413148 RepID=UPI003BEB7902
MSRDLWSPRLNFALALFLLAAPAAHAAGLCDHGLMDDRYQLGFDDMPMEDPDRLFYLNVDCTCTYPSGRTDPECVAGTARLSAFAGPEPARLFDIDAFADGPQSLALRSGRTLTLSHDIRDLIGLRQGRIHFKLTEGDRVVSDATALSPNIYAPDRSGCASASGEAGMIPGAVELSYWPEDAPAIAALAQSRGWQATDYTTYDRAGPEVLLTCHPGWDGTGEPAEFCTNTLWVGPGMELASITAIHSATSAICATWPAEGAGAPPMQIGSIALGTLLDPANPQPPAVAGRLGDMLETAVFDPRVKLSPPSQLGAGHLFGLRVLGPGPTLGIDQSSGFWYQVDLSLSVGLDMGYDGNLFEKLELTVLDVVEIRAPDTFDTLPRGIVEGGRILRLMRSFDDVPPSDEPPDEDEPVVFSPLSDDGMRIDAWQRQTATKLAQALGGEVYGGIIYEIGNDP